MRRWPRWLAEPTGRWVWLLLWPAGAVVGIAAEWRLYGWADPGDWVPDLLTGWTMIACGLAGWSRRSSYSNYYRRMLPRLLGALEFRCNNTAFRR